MKIKKQPLHLKLKRNKLVVYQTSEDGKLRRRAWNITRDGSLPNSIVRRLKDHIEYHLQRSVSEDSVAISQAICAGLRDAAESCGCQYFFYRAGATLAFYLNDQPLIAFEIPKTPIRYTPSPGFLHSDAVFRWTVRPRGRRTFELVAQKANPKWCA